MDSIQFFNYDNTGYPTFDSDERLISGTIIDEQGNPVEGAEIIVGKVDDNELTRPIQAFVKTKKDGKYCFIVDRENYDIIVRSPKHNAKTLKNHLFIPDDGFIPQVIKSSVMFRKGGEWLWISN
ncbi:hypothetical protein D3C71_1669160 [compost metagenome]